MWHQVWHLAEEGANTFRPFVCTAREVDRAVRSARIGNQATLVELVHTTARIGIEATLVELVHTTGPSKHMHAFQLGQSLHDMEITMHASFHHK